MKLITLISILLLSTYTEPAHDLYGKWKLTRIELSDSVIIPNKIDYFLTISSDKFTYNQAINSCWIDDFSISEDSIKYDLAFSTLICCGDDRIDSISKYLNYKGRYEISDSVLVIQNSKGTYYLIKEE